MIDEKEIFKILDGTLEIAKLELINKEFDALNLCKKKY